MARIKAVLNERRLAYEGAIELIEKQRQKGEDAIVMEYQRQKQEERKRVLSRRELTERRREARLKAHEEAQTGADVVQAVPQPSEPTDTSSNLASSEPAKAVEPSEPTEAPSSSFTPLEDARVVDSSEPTEAPSSSLASSEDAKVVDPSEPTETPSSSLASSEEAKAVERQPKKAKEVQRKPPSNPVDAAADALFGGGRR